MSFLRKGIFASGGHVVTAILGVLVGVLFSRQLGPDGMGQYELLRSTGLMITTFFSTGLSSSNVFFLNNQGISPAHIASNSIKISLLLGTIAATSLVAAILALPGYFGEISALVAVFLALGIGVTIGRWALRSLLVAQLAVYRMVSTDLIKPAVMLIGGGGLVLFGKLGLEAALVVFSMSLFASFGLVLVYVRQDIDLSRRIDWRLLRDVLAYGLKLASSHFLYMLASTITVMLLRYLRPGQFAEVGLYSRAIAVCGLVRLVPMALGPLMYAKWSGMDRHAISRQAEMGLRMSAAYALSAALLVVFLGKYVLWFLYGARFVPAQEALYVLAPALVFTGGINVYNRLLAADGRAAITAYISAGTVAVLTVVTWLAVPSWGIRGAALGALCGHAFSAVAGMGVCWKLYGLSPLNCLIIRWSDIMYVRKALSYGSKGANRPDLQM